MTRERTTRPDGFSNEDQHGKKILTLWIVLLALVLLSAEALARFTGHTPSLTDDPPLWALERDKLEAGGLHLTIVGASRVVYGIDMTVLDSVFPSHRAVQLGIRGASPSPVLEHLARVPPGPGIVIVSMAGVLFEERGYETPTQYVEYWNAQWRPALRWERKLRSFLQRRLAFLRPELDPRTILVRAWRDHTLAFAPDPRVTDARRSVMANRDHLIADRQSAVETARRRSVLRIDPIEWEERLALMMRSVDELVAGGNRVVFVRMPSSGPLRDLEERLYPRAHYWRQLEDACRDDRCLTIHFEDYEELARYEPGDHSHLASEDRTGFTRSFVVILREAIDGASLTASTLPKAPG